MNILILGANGYLGSKMVHALLNQGTRMVCTRRSTSDMTRLHDLLTEEKITFVPATVEAIEATLNYNYFDWVLNIACNYGKSDVLYGNVLESNIEFPLKVLNKVAEYGTRNFLTIGTGLPEMLNMYSFSKSMFSRFGRFYADKHEINFYNMKLQMFYGNDEPKDRFISNLVSHMLAGDEINVTLGTQHRDIISVEDVVRAIINVMNSDLTGYWEIPVGTGVMPAISEIVDFVWNKTGRKSNVNKGAVPMRKNEPDCVADISVLEQIGEWNPVFWKDGLQQMINSIRGTL